MTPRERELEAMLQEAEDDLWNAFWGRDNNFSARVLDVAHRLRNARLLRVTSSPRQEHTGRVADPTNPYEAEVDDLSAIRRSMGWVSLGGVKP